MSEENKPFFTSTGVAVHTQKAYTVLAFDPGLSNTAWSVVEIRPGMERMTVIRCGTMQLTKEVSRVNYKEGRDQYGIRIITLALLEDSLQQIFEQFKPDFVVTEDAFYQPGRLSAYTALTQWLTILERFALRNGKKIYKIPTKSAKQAISGRGDSGKENVQSAILANDNIKFKQKNYIAELSEHEADSIAVAWYFKIMLLPEALSHVFPAPLDISQWDLSKITNVSNMFKGATPLKEFTRNSKDGSKTKTTSKTEES